jgi:uncharacterized protein DUF4339
MKFLCGSCKTRYQISDARVRGLILTILCRSCGSKMIVREPIERRVLEDAVGDVVITGRTNALDFQDKLAVGADDFPRDFAMESGPTELPLALESAEALDDRAEWYVAADGAQLGPMPFTEVARRVLGREIRRHHHVWHEGFAGWRAVRDEPSLVPFIPPPARARPLAVAEPPKPQPPNPAISSAEMPGLLPPPRDVFADLAKVEHATAPGATTQFLVEAAGVKEKLARKRFAIAAASTLVLALAGFLIAWVGGVVKVSIPGSGRVSAPSKLTTVPVTLPATRIAPDRLKRLAEDPADARRRLAAKRNAAAEERTVAFGGVSAPRGDAVASIPLDAEAADRAIHEPPVSKLPEMSPADAVLPESGDQLKPEAVAATIRARRQSIASCYEQALKANPELRGKVELDMRIEPSGAVSKIQVHARAAARPIAECIADKLREWRFPGFAGSTPQDLRIPLLLDH